jgi:hypothetical protein
MGAILAVPGPVLFPVALVLLATAPSAVEAQRIPVVRTDTVTIGAAGPLHIGASAGALVPTGEAFYDVARGSALHVFLARAVEPFDELRLGVGYSRHRDDLAVSDVVVRTIYIETLYGTGTATHRLRLGPRFAYIHQSREIFANRMHTVGLGAIASLVRTLGSRAAIELSFAMTGSMMPGTDLKDPNAPKDDGWSSAWLRELRLGFTARPW